jgi:hypothetical protein
MAMPAEGRVRQFYGDGLAHRGHQSIAQPVKAHRTAAAASATAMRRQAETRKAVRGGGLCLGAAPGRGGKSVKCDMGNGRKGNAEVNVNFIMLYHNQKA